MFSASQHQFLKSPWRTWIAMYWGNMGPVKAASRFARGRTHSRERIIFRQSEDSVDVLRYQGLNFLRPVQIRANVSPLGSVFVVVFAALEIALMQIQEQMSHKAYLGCAGVV